MIRSELLLSVRKLAEVFDISERILATLVKHDRIPCLYPADPAGRKVLRFDVAAISAWLKTNPSFYIEKGAPHLQSIKDDFRTQFPAVLASLKSLDRECSCKKRGKGYSLLKVPSKKYGFLYYVRYIAGSKLLPSKWNTHTNDKEGAIHFALANRDRIVGAYFENKSGRAHQAPSGQCQPRPFSESGQAPDNQSQFYSLLEEYYKKDSDFIKTDKSRGRSLSEKTRSVYCHFVTDVFVPFLKENGAGAFAAVNPPIISKFQETLLKKRNKPLAINRYFGSLKVMFSHFIRKEFVGDNAFRAVEALKIRGSRTRSCHEIDKMKGAFNSSWDDKLSYML
jgi:hypothetical protein